LLVFVIGYQTCVPKLRRLFKIGTLCFMMLVAACGTDRVEVREEVTPETDAYPAIPPDTGYPPPIIALSPTQAEHVSGYPPPSAQFEDTSVEGPTFQLLLPLKAGARIVNGTAPPGLDLAIADITFNGVTLGTGMSDPNGNFAISVSPLRDGHRIGVTVAELEPGRTLEDTAVQLFTYRGEGFMNIPNLGIFFDTALVEP
jgi:hypothetical protein